MFGMSTQVCYNMEKILKNHSRIGEKRMFTRASARSAIGNPAMFARGGAYVQEGRVSRVTVRETDTLQVYEGLVRSPDGDFAVMFEYDPQRESFAA